MACLTCNRSCNTSTEYHRWVNPLIDTEAPHYEPDEIAFQSMMENFLLVLQSAKRRPDDSEGQLSQKSDIEDKGTDDSSERPKKMQKTGNAALKWGDIMISQLP